MKIALEIIPAVEQQLKVAQFIIIFLNFRVMSLYIYIWYMYIIYSFAVK